MLLESLQAWPMGVMMLVRPGPVMVKQTPGSPVALAKPSAMKPAPCSWRVRMWLMRERGRARYISTLWTPGMPKMVRTP